MKSLSNAERVSGNGSRVHFDCQLNDNYFKQPSDQGQDVPLMCRGTWPRDIGHIINIRMVQCR